MNIEPENGVLARRAFKSSYLGLELVHWLRGLPDLRLLLTCTSGVSRQPISIVRLQRRYIPLLGPR